MSVRKVTITAFIIVSALILGLTVSCKNKAKEVTQTQLNFKKEGTLTIFKKDSSSIALDIEIADTDFDRETGLMYRTAMKTNRGMLFVFDDEAPRSFYMKNTEFALDLIYINANQKIISFQKNAQPFIESSLPSEGPAKYVLEINAGLVEKWQLSVGDSIAYKKEP